jgi:transcriptional regulator with XRE-family HTH domain
MGIFVNTKLQAGIRVLIVRSASEVLNEIREIKGLQTDTALGEIFGVKQSTVASWRSRNALPYEEIINFCIKEGISTDTLFIKREPVEITKEEVQSFRENIQIKINVDDLFSTRLVHELRGRTIEWLSNESRVDLARINEFIRNKAVPTVDELDAIADALDVRPRWLAERSPSQNENWTYEYYKKDNPGMFPAEVYKLYLVAAEKFIDKMQGLIKLSPEQKADVINTACRVHMKETATSKEMNADLIIHLLMMPR